MAPKKYTTRKSKLVKLSKYLDLETEELFPRESRTNNFKKLYTKVSIDRIIDKCDLCDNLNITNFTKCVCGYGNLNSNIILIGEAPCSNSMKIKMPFAWKSGYLLDTAFILSTLHKRDLFITNAIHCHLAGKRTPTEEEIKNCSRHLQSEISLVKPKLVLTLGNIAKLAMETIKTKAKVMNMKHPASFLYNPRGTVDYIIKLSILLDKYK